MEMIRVGLISSISHAQIFRAFLARVEEDLWNNKNGFKRHVISLDHTPHYQREFAIKEFPRKQHDLLVVRYSTMLAEVDVLSDIRKIINSRNAQAGKLSVILFDEVGMWKPRHSFVLQPFIEWCKERYVDVSYHQVEKMHIDNRSEAAHAFFHELAVLLYKAALH